MSFRFKVKVKVKVKSLSRVRLFATPWTVAHQAPPSMGFSRQEYWSGLPFIRKLFFLMRTLCKTQLIYVFKAPHSELLTHLDHILSVVLLCLFSSTFSAAVIPETSWNLSGAGGPQDFKPGVILSFHKSSQAAVNTGASTGF